MPFMDKLINLFTEDAIFESPSGFMKASGRNEIFEIFVEMFKIRGNLQSKIRIIQKGPVMQRLVPIILLASNEILQT